MSKAELIEMNKEALQWWQRLSYSKKYELTMNIKDPSFSFETITQGSIVDLWAKEVNGNNLKEKTIDKLQEENKILKEALIKIQDSSTKPDNLKEALVRVYSLALMAIENTK